MDRCHADSAIVGQDQFLERSAPVSRHREEPLLRHREDRPLRLSRFPVVEDSEFETGQKFLNEDVAPGVCQVLGNVVIVLDHGYTCSTLSDVRLEHDWKCQSVSLPKGPDATQLLFVVETSAEAFGARDKFGRAA